MSYLCTKCHEATNEIVERHDNYPVCPSCGAIATMIHVAEDKQRVVVCLGGGIIGAIHASRLDDNLEVVVLDYDIDGMDEDDIEADCEALGHTRGFLYEHNPTEIPDELNADIDRILAAREEKAKMNWVTDEEHAALKSLRSRGFAVTVFTPGEVNNANPRAVEDSMVERGWQTISMEGK